MYLNLKIIIKNTFKAIFLFLIGLDHNKWFNLLIISIT